MQLLWPNLGLGLEILIESRKTGFPTSGSSWKLGSPKNSSLHSHRGEELDPAA